MKEKTSRPPLGYRIEQIQDDEGKAINVMRNISQRKIDQLFELELIDSHHYLAAEKFFDDYMHSGYYEHLSIGLDYNDKGSSAFWDSADESQCELRYKKALRGLPASLRGLVTKLVLEDCLPSSLSTALERRLMNLQKHDLVIAIRAGLTNLQRFYGT